MDRAVWEKAGGNGFLCMTMSEEYGGAGADRLYAVAQLEVNSACGPSGIGVELHNEIVAPDLLRYIWEYPITRAFADARVQRIYGGSNEIMKEVITRSMGLAGK